MGQREASFGPRGVLIYDGEVLHVFSCASNWVTMVCVCVCVEPSVGGGVQCGYYYFFPEFKMGCGVTCAESF